MLGRRDPQRSLFEAQAWPHRVPEDSFHTRMGAVNDVPFKDDDQAGMYCDHNRRPGVPPRADSGGAELLSCASAARWNTLRAGEAHQTQAQVADCG